MGGSINEGGVGLGRGGSFTSVDFSVQYGSLRDMEEARMAMLAFDQDADILQVLRQRTSYMMPQMTEDISPCINLGEEYSALQLAWRQGRPLLKASTLAVRGIRWLGMAHLQQGLFVFMGRGGGGGNKESVVYR